jgi:hypothetical protein
VSKSSSRSRTTENTKIGEPGCNLGTKLIDALVHLVDAVVNLLEAVATLQQCS